MQLHAETSVFGLNSRTEAGLIQEGQFGQPIVRTNRSMERRVKCGGALLGKRSILIRKAVRKWRTP